MNVVLNYYTSLRFFFIILVIISCAGKTEGVSDFQTGQNFNPSTGEIIEANLQFKIKKYTKGGKNHDLFNYIYFLGDNICFSFKFSDRIDNKKITVKFYHPDSGLIFPVERTDIIDNRCFGFSLLGSVLEKIYESLLDNEIASDMFCCKDIKIKIIVEVVEKKKVMKYKFPVRFRINYF